MVLGLLTLLVMGICAYAMWREGPLTAFAMCANVLVAGVLAFNFWEPLADLLASSFDDTFADGAEDAVAMMLIFLPVLMLLRWITNSIAGTHMEYPPVLYRGGAVVFGLLTGYLLAGFLVCMIQTLPVPRNFLQFEIDEPGKSHPMRAVMPPDLVWLAMMHAISDHKRLGSDEPFDKNCNFELRYQRFRRWDESGKGLPRQGELEP
jgi:hypothetical protein